MTMRPQELDSVELTEAIGCWPAGTPATVVDVWRDGILTIEVDNALLGDSLLDGLLDVPASAVAMRHRHPTNGGK